jgi:hypothetical protein
MGNRSAGAGRDRNPEAEQDGEQRHVAGQHRDDEAGGGNRHRTQHRAECQALLEAEIHPRQVGDPKARHDAADQHDGWRADK